MAYGIVYEQWGKKHFNLISILRNDPTKTSPSISQRNLQEGTLKVDGGKPIVQRSPGKLRQLNTDTGLYVGEWNFELIEESFDFQYNPCSISSGGMPNTQFYTRQTYATGINGCISEVILGGELRLNLDSRTLGISHNVEVEPGAPWK